MGNLGYLFIAYAIIWTALCIYIFNIAKKLSNLRKEIDLLKNNN